ncbi:MAG: cytochrome C oxidase subunit II [Candidatus Eremiobacterota bacterium]
MSHEPFHSALVSPGESWWFPTGKQEKSWVIVAFAWCMILFAMMPLWHWKGGQNPAGLRARVNPADFRARVDRFIADYQVGTDSTLPVAAPPPGADIYLRGEMWRWTPILKLQKGATYTLHLSSVDVNHGFSLYPLNLNFQVVPGYDYGLKVTPNRAGEFPIICNEFCGIGHHIMVGKIVVEEAP